jgi:Tubulin-tyrosine ligase family
VRLSSHAYTLDNMNYYVHLTNNAVQCNSKQYGSIIKGNIFSLTELEDHIRCLEQDNPKVEIEFGKGYFFDQIKHSMRTCFDATHEMLNKKGRSGCFELFGFDFMIDENYHMWLIECNSCPSLEESNGFLTSLMHRMAGRV